MGLDLEMETKARSGSCALFPGSHHAGRQGLVPTEQARAASVAYTKPLFDDMIDTLFGLDPSQSLQTVELSRARAFLSILAESKIDLRQNLSPADRDRETALFARISGIQKDLWRKNMTAAVR